MCEAYDLFLDDERVPPRDERPWVIVRSYDAAVEAVSQRGLPRYISFDHDLGADEALPLPTGYDFAKWLGEYILDHRPDLTGFSWYVHSQNPIGAENINRYLGNLIEALEGETLDVGENAGRG